MHVRFVATRLESRFTSPLVCSMSRSSSIHAAPGIYIPIACMPSCLSMNALHRPLPGSETWLPLCVPSRCASTFLHAHIRYLSSEACLLLLCPDPATFHQAADASKAIERYGVVSL